MPKQPIGEAVDSMVSGSKGGGDVSAEAAVANIKKIVASLTASTSEMANQLTVLQTTIKSGNISGLAKNIDTLTKKVSSDLSNSISALFSTFDTITATTVGMGAQTLTKTRTAFGGINTQLATLESSIKTSLADTASKFKTDIASSIGKSSKELGEGTSNTMGKVRKALEDGFKNSIGVGKAGGGGLLGSLVSALPPQAQIAVMVIMVVKKFIDFLDEALAAAINVQTNVLKRTTEAMGGVTAAMGAFGGMAKDITSVMAKHTWFGGETIKAAGDAIAQAAATASALYMFDFERNLTEVQLNARSAAQLKPGATPAGSEAIKMAATGLYSLNEAAEWSNTIISQGADFTVSLGENLDAMGKTLGLSASEMGDKLDKYMSFASTGEEAASLMKKTFEQAHVAADQLGITTTRVEKAIMGAAVQARFLNVDMKTVSKTMQLIGENKARLEAAGLTLRGEELGKMLTGLTGKKFSDSLHAYFGTKGGTEGDPISGLIKSKFGTTFESTLKSTAGGGFTATGGTGGDMVAQKLDVMKSAMMETAKDATSVAEKFQTQMMVAQQTFGMSEDEAKLLAVTDQEEFKKLASDPKWADTFKSAEQITREMKSIDAANYTVQQEMAGLARRQLATQIDIALSAAATAAKAMGVSDEKLASMGITEKSMGDLAKESFKNQIEAIKTLSKYGGAGMMKTADILEKGQKAYEEGERKSNEGWEAQGGFGEQLQRQEGGWVTPALAGRNVYSTAEDGRPEVFHSGSGTNILFAPGESGQIFNASATMNAFQRGLGGGGAEAGGGSPVVNRSGSGNQTVLNITINAGTLDKGSFAKLLENEVLNHIYG